MGAMTSDVSPRPDYFPGHTPQEAERRRTEALGRSAQWQPGLMIDSGCMTADDANRLVVEYALEAGWVDKSADLEAAEYLDGDGWTDAESNGTEFLAEMAEDAANYLNDLLNDPSCRFFPEHWRAYCEIPEDAEVSAYFGWDGYIGGFGLWVGMEE